MKKIYLGLFFILAGIFVIINQLGYAPQIRLTALVTTILIIPVVINGIIKRNYFQMFFFTTFALIINDKLLNIEAISPFPLLACALFLSIGFSILFKPKYKCTSNNENFDKVFNQQDESNIDFKVSFGSSIKYVNSENFKKANLDCSFGAMKIYFDNAKIEEDEAIINLNLSFSGLEMYIPKQYKIINKTDISLGGIEEKNKSNEKTTKTIILTGKVNLSGVEIIYI